MNPPEYTAGCAFLDRWTIGRASITTPAPPTDAPHRLAHPSGRSRCQAEPYASGPTFLPLIFLHIARDYTYWYISIDGPLTKDSA